MSVAALTPNLGRDYALPERTGRSSAALFGQLKTPPSRSVRRRQAHAGVFADSSKAG